MKNSSEFKHRLPFRHISIRVPWHDNGWDGSVCKNPKANASCLVLDRIRDSRDDNQEENNAGKLIQNLTPEERPACMDERGSFMAPFEFHRQIKHPYSGTSESHHHMLPTDFRHAPYSAAAIPFRWMSRKYAWDLAEEHGLDVDPSREPTEPFWLKDNHWVQNHVNQKSLLDGFSSAIEPDKSLCFFYVKQTPLAEDERRVIVGVGRVLDKSEVIEYNYDKTGGLRSYIWDRIFQQSIRPEFEDGFILPYQEILELAEKNPSIDPADYVAFAPGNDRYGEFTFVAEHVTNDGAIEALLACKQAIEKSSDVVSGPWGRVLKWIDARLSELWKLRGPYPGLGVAMTAFGVEHGSFLAYEMVSQLGENEDPWPLVNKVFNNPSIVSKKNAQQITPTLQAIWKEIVTNKPNRLALLKLIARMDLSIEQAIRFYVREEREEAGIECKDEELLTNPYLIYELDRISYEPISVRTVDRALFPDTVVRDKHPLPSPSLLEGPTDTRRVRALIIDTLENAANAGHTLLSRSNVVQTIRDLSIEPECPVEGDMLDVMADKLSPVIATCELKDGSSAYQLDRLSNVGNLIRSTIEKRIIGKRHNIIINWRQQLDKKLEKLGIKFDPTDIDEDRARTEKASALQELADSRFSVLIGPAGTGKTFLLSVLCEEPSVRDSGVLLLAPTGKARVKLQQHTGIPGQTIAQFLIPLNRYDGETGAYRLSTRDKIDIGKTVIVDEASMLTEEQLGALIDALKGVDRLILVGDPRQLPPIGAGRPFLDIVNHLEPDNVEVLFPKVGKGYTELTVRRRQAGAVREDLQLAEWFSGRNLGPGEDEIFSLIQTKTTFDYIRFVPWDNADDIHQKLLHILAEELKLDSTDDTTGFELSLGGNKYGDYVYFNPGAAEKAETWQIITPVRGMAYGVRDLNRMIQTTFRANTIEHAKQLYRRKIPKPMGPEGIVYGDKVINVSNHYREYVYPKEGALGYVANGEIGIAIGQFKGKNASWKGLPWLLKVEFSSQPGFSYDYQNWDFKEEGNPILELAYAVTIHKAQGSEFELCFLILPNPCRLLSRELLYTALTRQRDRIVVLYQGELSDLKKYTSPYYSESARRLTNLFEKPMPVLVNDRFLEQNLIHRSGKGEPMRSKSEVIIADSLAEAKIDYAYELDLIGTDGQRRSPDFTIEDADSGITYYWEHCGMLENEQYRKRWERKLNWYQEQKILPIDKGGGERGTLIITRDDPNGGISSQQIKELIRKIWS